MTIPTNRLIEMPFQRQRGHYTETLFNLSEQTFACDNPAGRLILQVDDTDKRLVLVGTN